MAGLPAGTPVMLALSGGADSAALLHLLTVCARRDGFSVLPVHVHHHIRGEEADRDAAFCRSLSETYGWEPVIREVDVPQLAAQQGKGLEETAREARYTLLEELMRERRIPLLVTAHHADDNLETVLFRLCRGTGLPGLCGIPPVRAFADGFLTRPLLPFTRKEILAYCAQEKLRFVEDSTNSDLSYARNRIRLRVVPELEATVGTPQKSVFRMTHALAQDFDYLCGQANDFLRANLHDGKLPVEPLQALHPAVRRRVLAAFLPLAPEGVHMDALEELLARGGSGSSCCLPGGYRAWVQGGMLAVLPELRENPLPQALPFREGSFSLCDGKLTVLVKKIENLNGGQKVHNLSIPPCLIVNGYSDIMLETLFWRCRKPGDTILLRGMHRQLRRLYREAGIPSAVRDAMPLLCDRDGILWAPYVGTRDGCKFQQDAPGYLAQIGISGWNRSCN